MLFRYLTELKNSLGENEFKQFLEVIERDIKVNNIALNKRTSQKEFINICENYKMVLGRCQMSNIENCKELNEKHIHFLKKEGLDPKEFLHIETGYDYYKFYHIRTGKELTLRR